MKGSPRPEASSASGHHVEVTFDRNGIQLTASLGASFAHKFFVGVSDLRDHSQSQSSFVLEFPSRARYNRTEQRAFHPNIFLNLLPAFDAPVPDALRFTFPPLNNNSPEQIASSTTRFHDHLPTAIGADLIGHSIPDPTLFLSLRKEWQNVQPDEVQSIFHVTNDGNAHYYPIWILTWWELVLSGRQKQDQWRSACDWLSQAKSTSNHPAALQVFTQAWDYISHIGWDTAIPFETRCSAADLSFFLSNNWLATRHIDWMLESAQLRFESREPGEAQLRPPHNSVIFYSPEVLRGIIRRFETIPPSIPPEAISRFLSPLQNRIRNGERPLLYTVYNYSDVHWIALEVDFNRQVIRYGDSMGGQRSSARIRNIINAWLKATWGYDKFVSEQMPCGTQVDDATSCGVCAVNTIERQVFEDPLWDEGLASAYRASKFVEIAYRILVPNGSDSIINPPLPISRILANSLAGSIGQGLFIAEPPTSPHQASGYLSSDDNFFDGFSSDVIENVEFNALNLSDDQTDGDATDDPELVHRNQLREFETPEKTTKAWEVGSTYPDCLRSRSRRKLSNRQPSMGSFEATIKDLDNYAVLDRENPLYVRHSTCGNKFKMRQPYDTKNFKTHVQAKTCGPQATGASSGRKSKSLKKSDGAGMLPLTSFAGFKRRSDRSISTSANLTGPEPQLSTPGLPAMVASSSSTSTPSSQQEIERMCPGLSEEDMSGISNYLLRTTYIGGGSRAYKHFAFALYSIPYAELGAEEQQNVRNEAHGNVAWRVDESRNVVIASACTRIARRGRTSDGRLRSCKNCAALLKLRRFRAAVRYEAKPNQKFTNRRWVRASSCMQFAKVHGVYELIVNKDERTPAQRFLLQVLKGEMKDRKIFCGMVEVMAMMDDKALRGVGLQNAKYPPEFDQFCHEIVNISPLAYQTFRNIFGGRTASNFRVIRGRERRFPLAIDDGVFEIAQIYFSSINYTGPVCLSCDDTKLLPALKTYYDTSTKLWYLLGGTTGAIAVASTEELTSILKDGKLSKASKLRLWVLQVPLPHIPPLAIAALPIASNATTQSLIGYLKLVIQGLLARGIHVISYATDGSAIEQNIQESLFMSMDKYRHYTVPHPSRRLPNSLSTPDPLDFKLGLLDGKTKDNPCVIIQDSKHALKTLRNTLYSGARLLVMGSRTPMYSQVRDIAEDPDSTLHRRDVENNDRQDDVSTECVFNQFTLSFVVKKRPQYLGLAVYLYIAGELGDAYQSRHILHADRLWMVLRAKFFFDFWRQFLLDSGYLLSRYFISQQAFNILTTIIEGLILLIYAYRDYMPEGTPLLPWLHSSEACEHFFAEMRKLVPDFTYLDFIFSVPKLRVLLRASYRNSPEFSAASTERQRKATGYQHTYMDSTNVDLSLLACFPTDGEIAEIAYIAYREAILLAQAVNILPDDLVPATALDHTSTFDQSEEDTSPESNTGVAEDLSSSEAFQELVELADAHDLPLESISIQRDNLVYANAALQTEATALIETFPQQRSLVELNFDILLQIRQRHQNPRALKSSKNYAKFKAGVSIYCKTASQQGEVLPGSLATPHASEGLSTETSHAALARSFLQTLRDHELSSHKISPRLQRWIYVKLRRDCLRKRGIPRLLEDIATARITIIDPIKPGTFVWIMLEKQIMLGRVMAIYIKEGGYNGMNLWVPQTTHLGHISYVAVQTYQKVASRAKYRAIHLGRPMEIPYYQLVPTNELLMRVGFVNTPGSETEDIELKDRHILDERDELARLLPELEKAGIPRVGSKARTGS
ncbi:methionyl-tRNA aminoacylation [Rhizoctonia solani]|uniref:Methionyl-tRNA aminoacylation n=1 Tax=Rhizoctonia solani TaxID=456999 RepID=A0A8H7IGQ7_9AGAM|nr:methionyl-tRNA aminoacylation [Rhizoctonia solani]